MIKDETVLLISYNFYPENNPRSFRTVELAKEFSRKGYLVDIIIPNYNYDYSDMQIKYNFHIIKTSTGFLLNKNSKNKSHQNIQKYKNNLFIKNKLLELFNLLYLGGRHFEYWFGIAFNLFKLKKKYSVLISIGLPFSVHLGVAIGTLVNRNISKTKIADYGDPFTYNPDNKWSNVHKYIEKWVLKFFDFITVPTNQAIPSYELFKDRQNIKVIPQGFSLDKPVIPSYKPNVIPTFAYAGIFYKNIRNPKDFFLFLSTIKENFCFVLYTDMENYENRECIVPYIELLDKKLLIKPIVNREQCILELSQMDFLINMENKSSSQVPSKLIDYHLAKRPIFTFSMDSFRIDLFFSFLHGKYIDSSTPKLDISNYDIKIICQKFIDLHNINIESRR